MSLWDTIASGVGKVATWNIPTQVFGAVTGRGTEDFAQGVTRLLGGSAPAGQRYSFEPREAAAQTFDTFTPDYLYQAPSRSTAAQPGYQAGEWLPQGLVPDALEKPLAQTGAVIALAAIAVLAVSRGR